MPFASTPDFSPEFTNTKLAIIFENVPKKVIVFLYNKAISPVMNGEKEKEA